MSRSLARVISTTVLVLSVVSVATSVALGLAVRDQVPHDEIFVHGDLDTPGMREVVAELEARVAAGEPLAESLGGDYNPGFAVVVVALLVWIVVGVFIVWRQPRNWAGWLFIITGATFPILTLLQGVTVYGLKVDPGAIPFIGAFAVIAEFALYPVLLLPLLFLLYPDGHLPSPRWRWAVVALVGGSAIAFFGFLLRPGPFNAFREDGIVYENPLGIDAFAFGGAVIAVAALAALGGGLSTGVAVVQRFRRSRGDERRQMRLLAFVGATAAALIGLMFAVGALGALLGIGAEAGEDPPIFAILFGLAAFTIAIGTPAAYLVAIFRHRLWDMDIVIRKAVVFALVAGIITVLALVLVLVVPVAVFGTGLSGWERGLLVLGIALGMLVGPLRGWARRIADRLVFGGRATPYEALTTFSERVAETYATEDVLPRMAHVLAEATGAASASVSLVVGSELREVATWPADGDDTGDPFTVAVLHQGEELGALTVRMPPNDPMDTPKERLVTDLAAQAGPVLRNVRLIEELRASRRRLVAAQDEERRRLERNIHDGAQQQLVALSVKARLAEQMIERDPTRARELVAQVGAETKDALEDLRDLARGIYPPLLADKGLVPALEAQARKLPVPAEVHGEGIGRFDRDVEAGVYFCVLEALNNVSKYAEASRVDVRLSDGAGELRFEVADDGAGFDPNTSPRGTGRQGMVDRLAALGGSVQVRSAPGAGTTVTGVVPTEAVRERA
jgi:signal transduction histidine kinase